MGKVELGRFETFSIDDVFFGGKSKPDSRGIGGVLLVL